MEIGNLDEFKLLRYSSLVVIVDVVTAMAVEVAVAVMVAIAEVVELIAVSSPQLLTVALTNLVNINAVVSSRIHKQFESQVVLLTFTISYRQSHKYFQ